MRVVTGQMAHWSSSTRSSVRIRCAHCFRRFKLRPKQLFFFFLFFVGNFLEKFGYKEIDNILLKSIDK